MRCEGTTTINSGKVQGVAPPYKISHQVRSRDNHAAGIAQVQGPGLAPASWSYICPQTCEYKGLTDSQKRFSFLALKIFFRTNEKRYTFVNYAPRIWSHWGWGFPIFCQDKFIKVRFSSEYMCQGTLSQERFLFIDIKSPRLLATVSSRR